MTANGILILDKSPGRTSRWATNQVSRLLQEKKAGHLGTLDPIATGVLPILLGRATRLARFLEYDSKVYRAVIRLGAATDSQDRTGKIISEAPVAGVTKEAVRAAALLFKGEIEQVPPMHSALKQDGQRLYKLARAGIEVKREPRKVTIFEIEVEEADVPLVTLRVRCSPGTYLRTIAHDLGERLGCGGHLAGLTRLASGPFTIEQAVSLDGLTPEGAAAKLLPLAGCLPHFPAIELSPGQYAQVRDGISLLAPGPASEFPPGKLHRLLHGGELAAVAESHLHGETVLLKPVRVM